MLLKNGLLVVWFSSCQTSKMCSVKAAFWLACLLAAMQSFVVGENLRRSKRFLIFPRQAPTRHQFIGGIGIPADLDYESLTVGHVLKAEFYLPYNATVFRENPYLPEYKTSFITQQRTKSSSFRWDIYAYIVNRLESYGYNGPECMLKAICEANSLHFARHYSVFAELMHIFLSPTSSTDLKTADETNYKEAERIGNSKEETCEIYACNMSLLNWISKILKLE